MIESGGPVFSIPPHRPEEILGCHLYAKIKGGIYCRA